MKNNSLEGFTLAVTDLPAMLDFYHQIFGLEFTPQEMFGSILHTTSWSGLKVLFCPASLAENTAEQNRHQFDVVVSDIHKHVKLVGKWKGKVMGEIAETPDLLSVGIYDPDGNSLVIKQLK